MQNIPKPILIYDVVLGMIFIVASVLRFQEFLRISLSQSSDLCWLIRTGDWILLHRDLPTRDIFCWWLPDRTVVPYQWIFEIAASAIHKIGGIWSIGLLSNVMGALFLFWFLPRNWLIRGIPFSVTFLMLSLVGSTYWQFPRPQMFVWLYAAILLQTLEELRKSDKSKKFLLLLPPLILLWANTHPSFAFALFAVSVYFTVSALKTSLRSAQLKLGAIWIACILSTLLTPKGTLFISHALSFANGNQYLLIHEVLPAYKNPDLFPFLFYSAITCVLFMSFWKDLCLEKRILSLCFLCLGLCVNRFEPLSVIFSWSCVGDSILLWASKYSDQEKGAIAKWFDATSPNNAALLWRGSIGFLIAILIAAALWKANVWDESEAQAQLLDHADKYLLSMPYKRGKTYLFNDPIIGNWMIYTATGKPFMSNQFDSYAPSLIVEVVQVLNGDHYSSFLNEQKIDSILIQNYCPLYQALRNSSEWSPLLDNRRVSYWEKKGPEIPVSSVDKAR